MKEALMPLLVFQHFQRYSNIVPLIIIIHYTTSSELSTNNHHQHLHPPTLIIPCYNNLDPCCPHRQFLLTIFGLRRHGQHPQPLMPISITEGEFDRRHRPRPSSHKRDMERQNGGCFSTLVYPLFSCLPLYLYFDFLFRFPIYLLSFFPLSFPSSSLVF